MSAVVRVHGWPAYAALTRGDPPLPFCLAVTRVCIMGTLRYPGGRVYTRIFGPWGAEALTLVGLVTETPAEVAELVQQQQACGSQAPAC